VALSNALQTVSASGIVDGPPGGEAPKESRAPLSLAERVRRCRERKRRGLLSVEIELRRSERAGLVQIGLLASDGVDDRSAVRDALYRFLERCFPLHE